MKKRIFLLGTGIFLAVLMQAQVQIYLEEQEVGLPEGVSSAWVFPVAGEFEDAFSDLKEYTKERSELKMKKDGDELLIAKKVALPAIAQKRGDLVGYANATGSIRSMALIFQLGYDISLNSTEWTSEMESLRLFARDFMSYHFEQEHLRRTKVLEKELKSLEKEKSQDTNRINNLTNKINSTSKKIGKETETAKIDAYQADIQTFEADLKELMDVQPGLETKITQLKDLLEQNRTESHNYLIAIRDL
jgi:uncharacterized protein YukE